jgi:tetratricopeptide (TPR) repeat protein
LIILFGSLPADQKEYLFEQGNTFFEDQEYTQAVGTYEDILAMGYESAELYYNLGNAYYKIGDFARAILNYERALRLHPQDEDIRFNLEIARMTLVDEIPEIPELFYIKYFKDVRALFGLKTLTYLTLAVYFIFIGCLVLWLTLHSAFLRRFFRITSFTIGVFLVIFSILFISKIHNTNSSVEAIIMSPEVYVRSSPTESGTDLFAIHSGLKVRIENQSSDWYEIRLPDGKEGWVENSHLEII